MSRIRGAYELKLRDLLQSVGAKKAEKGMQYFGVRAEQVRKERSSSLGEALGAIYGETLARVRRARPTASLTGPMRFLCDAGLGGLARWLRGAGYEAFWRADIHDHELVREAQRDALVIVTTDSLLMERRVIRRGEVKALWIPPVLRAAQQLVVVLEELRLPVLDSRCMECGGVLKRVDKEAVKHEIPPRTYKWLDEFWKCASCGKLFWQGTHYERIRQHLQSVKN